MFREIVKDGMVWLAGGLFCLTIFFVLQEFAGESGLADFFRGFCLGLAAIAFGAAAAFLARRQRPGASRPSPAKKGRK